ncbi:hypothetical protein TNCV_713541, partial [Trichonephila clavipes]
RLIAAGFFRCGAVVVVWQQKARLQSGGAVSSGGATPVPPPSCCFSGLQDWRAMSSSTVPLKICHVEGIVARYICPGSNILPLVWCES